MADEKKPIPRPSEHICVVIGRTRHKMVQIEIQEAARRGARMIELRLDYLAKAPDFKRLLHHKPCALVATVRRPTDGGRWSGTEQARQTLIRQAIVAGFDWVDIETDIADVIRRFQKVKRIVSYHNMREVPADLETIHGHMCDQDPDVVKVAVRAQRPEDNLRLLDLVRKAKKPTVAFCMGDVGMPSRLLGAKYGAPFTYAGFNKERSLAPGLPSFEELRQIYDYDRINADTQVFGVIGDPVAHSLSPAIHNVAFRKLEVNALYVPFRVPGDSLGAFLKDFDRIPVQGYSVTIPHKEEAATLAEIKESNVERIHVANTLLRQAEGESVRWSAFNSDYSGSIDSLRAALAPGPDGQPYSLVSRPTLILGAGGVARAIAHALHRESALVTISSRTLEKARKLADEIDSRSVDWAARHNVQADMVINCTPVGMHPKVDESPLHPSFLRPGLVVFDTVYNPETTLLVKEARQRGCQVVTGVDFFVRQAAVQCRLFTGKEPPVDIMYNVVKRLLSPVTVRQEEE